MATAFAENENNDIFIDETGQLATVAGNVEALQRCKQVVETLRGELVFSPETGIDYFNTVLQGQPNLVQFNRQAEAQLRLIDVVSTVDSFVSNIVSDEVIYTASITTIFGTGEITNGL